MNCAIQLITVGLQTWDSIKVKAGGGYTDTTLKEAIRQTAIRISLADTKAYYIRF